MRRCTDLPLQEECWGCWMDARVTLGHSIEHTSPVMDMTLGKLLIIYLPNYEELCLSPVAVDFYCVLWQLNIWEFYSLKLLWGSRSFYSHKNSNWKVPPQNQKNSKFLVLCHYRIKTHYILIVHLSLAGKVYINKLITLILTLSIMILDTSVTGK